MAEDTYLIFHPTRLAFLRWYIIAVFVIAVSIPVFLDVLILPSTISAYKYYFIFSLIAAGVFFIFIAELLRKHDKYALTNYRIIEKSGIISIHEDSIYWEKLSNYSFNQNFFDRILNIGTVSLWSTGGVEEPEITIKSAPNVKKIIVLLDKLVQKK